MGRSQGGGGVDTETGQQKMGPGDKSVKSTPFVWTKDSDNPPYSLKYVSLPLSQVLRHSAPRTNNDVDEESHSHTVNVTGTPPPWSGST